LKSPPDSWWISFTYDAANDVVESSFRDVILETDEDVLCWRREVEKRLQRYGRPVDLLIDLEGLIVKPSAARSFGAHRAEVLAEHTRVSFRWNGNHQTRTSIYTSSVIHGADANIYDSREEALKALLAHREAGTLPSSRTPLGPASQRTPSQRSLAAASGPVSQRPAASGPVSQRPASSGPVSQRSASSGPVSHRRESDSDVMQPTPRTSSTPPPPAVVQRQGPVSKR
jgi:hypothetical protein